MGDLRKSLKEAAIQIGAGGFSGFVEVSIMHPLDVVKTRFQLQSIAQLNNPHYYYSITDCFVKIRKHEGFYAFWKGILPPILAETPKRSIKFLCFEQYQKLFIFGSTMKTPLTYSLAGTCAGITEAFFVNPFEVIKITIQSDKRHVKNVPSTWSVFRRLLNNEGFGGFYKGISATATRNGIFNGLYFGVYNSLKEKYHPRTDNKMYEVLYKIGLGFISGVLGSCFNIPFDVAKSRIQGPQPEGKVKYQTTFGTIRTVYSEEGWRALFKGLSPKLMRLGPGGAIMMVVYDYSSSFLKGKFQDS